MTGPSRRTFVEEIWYGTSPVATTARAVLAPLSSLFAVGISLRGAFHDRGFPAAGRAPAPVVSVGSLRVGGAGKTPFVIWLAGRLVAEGLRPCLVTRGYGGSGGPPFVVDPGAVLQGGRVDPALLARAGDEGVLLALRSNCPVAVGGDRLEACRVAIRELGPGAVDLFLLDDGFQHRRLARDLDIVLVSGLEETERLLPAGPLRETVASLARAGVVVTMGQGGSRSRGGPQAGPAEHGDGLRLDAVARPTRLVRDLGDDDGEALSVLDGRRVVAVAAIARPERFLASLEEAGARLEGVVLRRDHHVYDAADVREIEAAAASADFVVTTEKDLVKLAGKIQPSRLRALRIDVEVGDSGRLLERLKAIVAAPRGVRGQA